MTRARPVTLKHLAVTVLVVVLVNAQLTWWIIFVLRENRTRLGLERGRMIAAAEREADRLARRLEQAELAVSTALAAGARIETEPPPAPFTSWSWAEQLCTRQWTAGPVELTLRMPAGAGCVTATATAAAAERVLAADPGVEVVMQAASAAVGATPPAIAVEGTAAIAVRPAAAPWSAALHGYRHRILMMVSEGKATVPTQLYWSSSAVPAIAGVGACAVCILALLLLRRRRLWPYRNVKLHYLQ